jgi:ABC-2 type transport system permease protein
MRLFIWELRKLAGDGPARAGLVIVAVVLVLGVIGFRFAPSAAQGTSFRERVMTGTTRELPLPSDYRSGFGYARLVLGSTAGVLIPAVLCVVLGGIVAGESERGTLAEALTRPTGRWKIIAAKTGAGLVYCALLVCVAALVALVLSSLVLGAGELVTGQRMVDMEIDGYVVPRPEPEKLAGADAAGRLVMAYALAGVALAPLVALAVLASSVAERSRTATLVAAGAYFGLYSITHTPGMGAARRYFVLGHFEMWEAALRTSVTWGQIWRGAAVLAVTFVLLTVAAILVFKGREFPGRPGG